MDCKQHPVTPPKVVAIATDSYLTPTNAFADATNLPASHVPKYGQDITFGKGRAAPAPGYDVGTTDAVLKPKMDKLLGIFASQDKTGMARRLFTKFLAKQSSVTYFDDVDLNAAAAAHANIKSFCVAALSAPTPNQTVGKTRIHQALKQANWDIKKLVAPTDLGVPALNTGNKTPFANLNSGDFANGLGVMINGVQYVYVVATHYDYDQGDNKYCINLKFIFYDVFGLDDDDLKEFGEKSDGRLSTAAGVGITAWWQLQHQHGYAPLVTRFVLENSFEVPAT